MVKDLWTSSGDFFQRQWEYVYDKVDGDPFMLCFWGKYTTHDGSTGEIDMEQTDVECHM